MIQLDCPNENCKGHIVLEDEYIPLDDVVCSECDTHYSYEYDECWIEETNDLWPLYLLTKIEVANAGIPKNNDERQLDSTLSRANVSSNLA